MARESIDEPQSRPRRMRADDRIAVEHVHLVVAGPGPLEAQGLERRHAMRHAPPEHLVELRELRVERQVVLVERRLVPGNEYLAVGPEPETARIDDERTALELRRAGEHEHGAAPCPNR